VVWWWTIQYKQPAPLLRLDRRSRRRGEILIGFPAARRLLGRMRLPVSRRAREDWPQLEFFNGFSSASNKDRRVATAPREDISISGQPGSRNRRNLARFRRVAGSPIAKRSLQKPKHCSTS
jgi:hypothetical protein